MKILMPILHYRPVIGGFEIFIQNIAERLAKNMDVFVVTGKVAQTANKEQMGGLRIFRTSLFKLKDLSYSSWLYILTAMPFIFLRSFYIIKREKIKLVHCQGFLSGILGYLLKKTAKVPYVITIQSADFSVYHPKANIKLISLIYKYLEKKIFKNAIKCHAVSYHLKNHFAKYNIKNVIILPNGVSLEDFKPDNKKEITRKKLGFDTENLIICISRLESKNGTEDLIRATSILKNQVKDFKIVIIGKGSQEKKLKNLTFKLKLSENIKFVGDIPHGVVPKYLASADIFIRPSLAEGFGIVFIEAMACEVAVIGTPVGGILDFLKDKVTGLFCEPGNPKSIAEKIEVLIKNKELKNKLIENGKKLVKDFYDWDKINEKIKEIYKQTLNPKS